LRKLIESHDNLAATTAAEHFAELGERYDDSAFGTPGLAWVSRREVEIVSEAVSHLPTGASILDAGAGNGRFTELLAKRHGLTVTALDAVPEMLRAVEQRLPGVETVHAKLGEPLPFPTASFDAVVSIRVLKWVTEWDVAIRELARVVRTSGTLVIEITNRRSLARFGYDGAPITLSTVSEMRRRGRDAGIEWTSVRSGTHLPYPLWERASSARALRACTAVQAACDRVLGTIGARSLVLIGHRLPHLEA